MLLEESSHILKSEMGAIAQVAGLFHRTIRGERGAMELGTLAEAISAHMKPNKLATALIEMETTHNGAGGTVLPLDHMAEVRPRPAARHPRAHGWRPAVQRRGGARRAG